MIGERHFIVKPNYFNFVLLFQNNLSINVFNMKLVSVCLVNIVHYYFMMCTCQKVDNMKCHVMFNIISMVCQSFLAGWQLLCQRSLRRKSMNVIFYFLYLELEDTLGFGICLLTILKSKNLV